jgi:hypothetical protein
MPSFIGPGLTRALLEKGYALFLPNPRGSFGQGDAFVAANKRKNDHEHERDHHRACIAHEGDRGLASAANGSLGGERGSPMAAGIRCGDAESIRRMLPSSQKRR